jgi:hypothetical protein
LPWLVEAAEQLRAFTMDAPDALFAGGKMATPEAVAQFSAFGGTYKVHHELALS